MTAAELMAWRDKYGLRTPELAHLIGMSASGIRNKMVGRRRISRRMDRQTECIDLLIAAGIRPPGWPMRLNRRVRARLFE